MDERERETTRRHILFGRSVIRLIVASVLLNALVLAGFLTSTPERSPASSWITVAFKAKLRLDPIDPVKDKAELSELHLKSSQVSTPKCVACHGSMLESKVAFHRIHLRNELLPGLQCNNCHRRVDLTPRGNEAIVEWVDVGLCKKCHSEFPGLKPGSSMQPIDFEIDCTMCHSGNHDFRHDAPYLSQIIAPKECKGCHGGRVLPWDAAHERADWLQKHGTQALQQGSKTCFRCHDFGLKFCDTCHEKEPPSHRPADRWKNVHRDAARADTRACYTCHKLDFCRKCHLNHEQGWMERHAATVNVSGTRRCERCHSTSFCSYCHTGLSANSPSATVDR